MPFLLPCSSGNSNSRQRFLPIPQRLTHLPAHPQSIPRLRDRQLPRHRHHRTLPRVSPSPCRDLQPLAPHLTVLPNWWKESSAFAKSSHRQQRCFCLFCCFLGGSRVLMGSAFGAKPSNNTSRQKHRYRDKGRVIRRNEDAVLPLLGLPGGIMCGP